jgi:hypothetical protein
MKKLPVLALAGGLALSGAITTTASAADPAPTNVSVQWADDDLTTVRLSWDETSPQPNEIVLYNNQDTPLRQTWIPADAPNQLDVPKSTIDAGYTNPQFAVAVDAQGDRTSPLTGSPRFDSSLPGAPELVVAIPSGTSTLSAEWKAGPDPADLTPNDPLDRTLPPLFSASYTVGDQPPVPVGPTEPSGTRAAFTADTPAFTFSVADRNEWGKTTAKLVDAAASAPTLNVRRGSSTTTCSTSPGSSWAPMPAP